jgi:hypothetical protein
MSNRALLVAAARDNPQPQALGSRPLAFNVISLLSNFNALCVDRWHVGARVSRYASLFSRLPDQRNKAVTDRLSGRGATRL